jgi:hypothetical protein
VPSWRLACRASHWPFDLTGKQDLVDALVTYVDQALGMRVVVPSISTALPVVRGTTGEHQTQNRFRLFVAARKLESRGSLWSHPQN